MRDKEKVEKKRADRKRNRREKVKNENERKRVVSSLLHVPLIPLGPLVPPPPPPPPLPQVSSTGPEGASREAQGSQGPSCCYPGRWRYACSLYACPFAVLRVLFSFDHIFLIFIHLLSSCLPFPFSPSLFLKCAPLRAKRCDPCSC